jgi:hypothetical protein
MKISAESFPPLRILIVLGDNAIVSFGRSAPAGNPVGQHSLVSRYQAHLDHKWERKRRTAAMFKNTNLLLIRILHTLAIIMFILIRENSITKFFSLEHTFSKCDETKNNQTHFQSKPYTQNINLAPTCFGAAGAPSSGSAKDLGTCRSKIDILNIWFTLKMHFVGISFINNKMLCRQESQMLRF